METYAHEESCQQYGNYIYITDIHINSGIKVIYLLDKLELSTHKNELCCFK